jgi:hypothetical protein
MALADDISQAMAEQPGAPQQIFAGTVNSVDPLTVTLDGSGVALPCLAFGHVTLTETRRVGVIKLGADLVVVGSYGNDTILKGSLTVPGTVGITGAITYGLAVAQTAGPTSLTAAPSSGFTNLGPTGIAFKAPPSGKMLIKWSGKVIVTTAGGSACMSVHTRNGSTIGSGSDYAVADDVRCIEIGGPTSAVGAYITSSSFRLFGGLTPGNDYNVELRHKSLPSGTGSTDKGIISVIPVL